MNAQKDYQMMKAFPATMALEDTLHFLNQAPSNVSRKRRRVQYTAVPNKKLQLALLESSLKVLDLDLDLDFPTIEWNFSSDEEASHVSTDKATAALNKGCGMYDAALPVKEKSEQSPRKRMSKKRSLTCLASKRDTLVRCRSFLGHLSSFETTSGLMRSESLSQVPPISEGSR